jgi:hypothetical protein
MSGLMKLTDYNLQELIDKAIQANACQAEIESLNQYSSMEDLLENTSIEDKAFWFYWYALHVIKGRWIEAEEFIKTSPRYAYWYAQDVIKGRWEEAEEFIKTDPKYAYLYARDFIKNRWEEAEDVIKTSPCYAYQYAKYVIKGSREDISS